ncbi:hypothetical protein [uncultured Marivita sp.]|uniref:hypothetical protein n=1 Tax=uncultured Marivita sp. TaxID=888080 RepID=UPI002611EBA0|nr:hypothetical protein [uncultured Marivita sp.]
MTIYNRPVKTAATRKGEKARRRWSTALRSSAFRHLSPVEVMLNEEAAIGDLRQHPGQERAAWTTMRVRIDQAALLDLLRQRHLRNTGKELSRAEALAAIMSDGLEALVNRDEFRA